MPVASVSTINPLIPHLYGQRVFDGQRIARGVYKQVAVAAADTDVPVRHNLDRIPQLLPALIDWTGYTPRMKRGNTPWSTTTVFVQFDAPGTFWLWVF